MLQIDLRIPVSPRLRVNHHVANLNQNGINSVKIRKYKDVDKRLKSLQTTNPTQLHLLKIIDAKAGKEARELEQSLHKKFAYLQLRGEWFKYESELYEYINQL